MGSTDSMNRAPPSARSSRSVTRIRCRLGGRSTHSFITSIWAATSRTVRSWATKASAPRSWVSRQRFSSAIVCCALTAAVHAANDSELPQDLELRLQPRVCTLSATEDACNTTVKAQWRAAQDESLCLVIVDRPDIKKCWEHFTEGTYSIELVFDKDL